MTEFDDQIRELKSQFCTGLVSVFSHPLYFSYFVFFSPYIFKLLYFLFPLLITTFLLLVAVSLIIHPQISKDSDSKLCVFLSTFKDAEDIDEFRRFVEVEVDGVVFEIPTAESKENNRVKYVLMYEEDSEENPVEDLVVYEDSICNSEENPDGITRSDIDEPIKRCLEEEASTGWSGCVELDKEAIHNNKVGEQKEEATQITADTDNSETRKGSFGSYEPTRKKERSWKRTLECKLLQERYNVDAGEEVMDLLWETYERTPELRPKKKNEKTGTGKKCGGNEYNHGNEEQSNCLQAAAFKFSSTAGKSNSTIVRFSKVVLKRIGWLQHETNSSSTRHAKKGVKLN